MERDPNKRKVKPPAISELLNLDDIEGESSSDSDFRIEDHNVNSESDSDRASYLTNTDGLCTISLYILILIGLTSSLTKSLNTDLLIVLNYYCIKR